MASQVDIINLALGKLGQSVKIAAISDRTKEAHVFGGLWDAMRDEVLAARNWRWACASQAAALASEDPDLGWRYRYSLPNDCITLIAVTDENGLRTARRPSMYCDTDYVKRQWGRGAFDFEQSLGDIGTTVNTDVEQAYFIYIRRVIDTGRFPPMFVNALAWRLAAEAAPPIIGTEGGMKAQQSMFNGYAFSLSEASAHDKSQGADQAEDEMPRGVAARA